MSKRARMTTTGKPSSQRRKAKKGHSAAGGAKRSPLVMVLLVALFGAGLYFIFGRPSPVEFSVLAGSELKDLKPLNDDIEACANVRLNYEFSGTLTGAEKLAGGYQADIAWFSHAKYLSLLLQGQNRIAAQERIMLSPVVMGVKSSMARAWGWDQNPVTWRDVVAKTASGELRFAMTNPTASNSGFTSLIGVTAALSGNTDNFDTSTLDKQAMKQFFLGQELTSGSSGWLAEAYQAEQGRLEGMINYESVLLQLNSSGLLAEPLTLIYPTDGVVTADYPIMLMNKEKREGFDRLVACLKSPEMQTKLMQQTQRRPAIAQVQPDQRFSDALIIELPFPHSIEAVNDVLFAYLDEHSKPSHTHFVLDVSGSMQGERLRRLKDAMRNLTGVDRSTSGQFIRFRKREKVTLQPFDHRALPPSNIEITDTARNGDSMRELRSSIRALQVDGGTAVYSALQAAFENIRTQDMKQRYHSIVLLTDGENRSGLNLEQFAVYHRQLPELVQNVKIFPILFGDSNDYEMQRLAELTGGRVFDAHNDDLRKVFKKIRGYQ